VFVSRCRRPFPVDITSNLSASEQQQLDQLVSGETNKTMKKSKLNDLHETRHVLKIAPLGPSLAVGIGVGELVG
jgi:hypothetical protein